MDKEEVQNSGLVREQEQAYRDRVMALACCLVIQLDDYYASARWVQSLYLAHGSHGSGCQFHIRFAAAGDISNHVHCTEEQAEA